MFIYYALRNIKTSWILEVEMILLSFLSFKFKKKKSNCEIWAVWIDSEVNSGPKKGPFSNHGTYSKIADLALPQ